MKVISIHPSLNPFALKVARTYRGYNLAELSRNIFELSSKSIANFENGNIKSISLDKLKEIMSFLDWPFEFLYSNIQDKGKFAY